LVVATNSRMYWSAKARVLVMKFEKQDNWIDTPGYDQKVIAWSAMDDGDREQSVVAPAFGEAGNGVQYKIPEVAPGQKVTVQNLIDNGYLGKKD